MLQIFDDRARRILNEHFFSETWSTENEFTEGPVWNEAGYYLYSDIPANRIYRIDTATRTRTVFLEPSGCTLEDRSFLSGQPGSNGLAYDRAGSLYICQHGNGAVALYENDTLQTLIAGPDDKPFNSPNDIVVDAGGAVFFSDPPYGLKDQQLRPDLRQSEAAFYCWRDGMLMAFCKEYKYPNGLCLSPDERTVYVCSSKPFERKLLQYDALTLEFKGQLAEENCDGIKCDPQGNLWLCTKDGILLLSPQGERLALIALEKIPANCCWGGQGKKDLFVTAREHVYCLRGLRL
ncbi:SMP-30/gluconolactonase/LRE family protein [Flaviaesturariibacter flavus]|uniref:SMP-30/gluconolactonase/LRE family protein n=1 Tax=Flaviaesturariibacter flavus TaxID=2502780 RepID=A0A4R1BKQ3_9BACT|nr:SMP-30/gluconolactonase/LRE family protein [Flaviaesturariibacter flavus]TCJ17808.1 SMP-30/gluconolactonase/LRE family protein [Flaviaesturariibacter flavus]